MPDFFLPLVGCVLVFAASFLLVAQVRRYAVERSLLDHPNERSSHVAPTPRGGGLAFVVMFLLVTLVLYLLGAVAGSLAMALLGSGAGVAALGFWDDHGHVPVRWRLLGHFFAASWALFWLGGLAPVSLGDTRLDLGWFGQAVALLYLVWLLNLYNFMDGIDGLAAGEAICVCAAMVICYLAAGAGPVSFGRYGLEALLAIAVAGFFCWNFPRAKVFMGDVGSGFLGIVLGVLSIEAAAFDPALLWCWLIMLGVFMVDATFTLLHRLLRGEAVQQAHRSHAYQFAARRLGSHVPITLGAAALNLLWLLPWALLVAGGWVQGALALVVAYLPLIGLAGYFKAGSSEVGK